MPWKDIVVWVLQWAAVEVSKKWPKVGEWVKANAPAALAIISIVVEILEQALLPPAVHAGVAVPKVEEVVNLPVVGNFLGTLVVDNVGRKIVWHWLFGQIFGIKVAKKR